jgi:squalene-hopene/tetraprenyl-beta-curcumene cyclase
VTAVTPKRLEAVARELRDEHLSRRNDQGFWEGELSSSALATATAVTALAISDAQRFSAPVDQGIRWITDHVNRDGGWGDTIDSDSNLSTTVLCWAALHATGLASTYAGICTRAEERIAAFTGQAVTPDTLARAVLSRYGKDRSFSVPILTHCALSGVLGPGKQAWRHITPLPFELATLPHGLFKWLGLPVVSYALPALIAIGQARHHHAPSRNPIARAARSITRRKTLRILGSIQPDSGGFLEAAPLTSFVLMSLASTGHAKQAVAKRCGAFLTSTVRDDGSWPIDTNLATWVTTLSVNAGDPGEDDGRTRQWLLAQQYRTVHPYTHAAPGGWAWTHLPGGVPDVDDTAGALLALARLNLSPDEENASVPPAIQWLLNMQNRDGGFPTFCKGWGALPFDKSCTDLTAHVLRALETWQHTDIAILPAIERGLAFLRKTQETDGSWIPLWFGNQRVAKQSNPVFGTARVVCGLTQLKAAGLSVDLDVMQKGIHFLLANQNDDDGWGGQRGTPSSIEETGVTIEALSPHAASDPQVARALEDAMGWLVDQCEQQAWRRPTPIGLYFSSLWYAEKLYPIVFARRALACTS